MAQDLAKNLVRLRDVVLERTREPNLALIMLKVVSEFDRAW